MGHVFVGYRDCMTGLWVAPHLRRSVMEREAAKTPELDALSGGRRFDHVLEHRADGEVYGTAG
jgi:hypothetical protein